MSNSPVLPKWLKTWVAIASVVVLAGCGGAPVVIQYYVIDPSPTDPIANLDGRSIQIMDLKLPQYLERFQIARRQSSNQLTFSSNQQWGENLRKNLFRTMTRNLSDMLGTADVASAISRSFSTPDYSIRVSLESFEQGVDGKVRIAARYQVSQSDGKVLATKEFASSVDRNSGANYSHMVSDLQDLFGELCSHMAITIKQLDEQHAG